MKKIFSIFLILVLTIISTGCFKRDSMEDITIYTTVYPIEYIIDRLYGKSSTVHSIYPDGVIVSDYDLTEKQIRDYSKANLFIFNGLSEEKKYVSKFFEHNQDIKIIDTASSMEYNNRIEELWLNPSNLLMLAQNIKRGLFEYISNHYLRNSIEENYEALKVEISNLDASINLMVDGANNKTIVVTDHLFNFLSKYGFNVISIGSDSDGNVSDKALSQARNLIASKKISYIFAPNNEELSKQAQALVDETKVKVAYLHTLSNITETERLNKKDYIGIMNENIEALKDEIYD